MFLIDSSLSHEKDNDEREKFLVAIWFCRFNDKDDWVLYQSLTCLIDKSFDESRLGNGKLVE